ACNLLTHRCESSCGDGKHSLCHGSCCAAGTCATGTSNSACGTTGDVCAVCSGDKPTCEAGVCGSTCGAPTDGTCSGGFCCHAGACVQGTEPAACGSTGTCATCQGTAGLRCETPPGGPNVCGCDAAS